MANGQKRTASLALVYILLLAANVGTVQTARILAVLPIVAKSHHILSNAVLRTLAQAGHEVVSFSGLPADQEVANLTVLHLPNTVGIKGSLTREIFDSLCKISPVDFTSLIWHKSNIFVGNVFGDKRFVELLNSNEKFDLILLQAFYAQEPFFALGHKFQAPIINLQPFGAFSLVNRNHGNSLNLAFIPDYTFSFTDRMSFYQRALNAYSILKMLFKYYIYFIPEQEKLMKKIFNDPLLPPLTDLMHKHLALTFQNSHSNVHYTQPYTPNIQTIGGIHLAKERNPLPTNIKEFLDESPEGVIYMSMGSIVPDHLLGDEYFNNFLASFRRLPQRILWKTNRHIDNLPTNVMTSEWVPQQDVLAHPNVKVFMTHGGMFSQHEAIHAGVPVICTPYYGDQRMNAQFYQEKGIGVVLHFDSLSEATISSALKTVLKDSKYRDNMARMSHIYRDRAVSPADTVLYWVEYVIRHNGAPHLRPASAAMPLYQLFLLDVIGTVLTLLIITIVMTYVVMKRLLGALFKDTNSNIGDSKKYN